jgi:hypothetical protein
MWHRTSIADLLIAETVLHNDLGVVRVNRDFERIAGGPRPRGSTTGLIVGSGCVLADSLLRSDLEVLGS